MRWGIGRLESRLIAGPGSRVSPVGSGWWSILEVLNAASGACYVDGCSGCVISRAKTGPPGDSRTTPATRHAASKDLASNRGER